MGRKTTYSLTYLFSYNVLFDVYLLFVANFLHVIQQCGFSLGGLYVQFPPHCTSLYPATNGLYQLHCLS